MSSLKETLGTGPQRQALIDDACHMIDLEVADKSGLSGVAIKGAYAVVKGIKPGFVREVVNALLDEFLDALEPLHQQAEQQGSSLSAFLLANPGPMAEALLAVTDKRAEKAESGVIKKTYGRLRPTAKKQVEAAAPRLAELLARHLPSTATPA